MVGDVDFVFIVVDYDEVVFFEVSVGWNGGGVLVVFVVYEFV